MQKSYDVAVLFGGVSNEHEISVITGTMVCNVLKNDGKSVLPIYITRSGEMRAGEGLADLTVYKGEDFSRFRTCCVCRGGVVFFNKKGAPKSRAEVNAAINCCHGGLGEGGAAAGLFALNGVPFASANLFESAAFMDKFYTKLVLQSLGVKTAKYGYSRDIQGAIAAAESLNYPVIVKPAKLGSSVGISKADNEEQLLDALKLAFALDDGVIIEEFLSPRREINCAAYFAGGEMIVSECEEVFTGNDLLSYDDKYSGGGKRRFPAEICEEKAEFIKAQTASVYKALNMRGIVRFDYILRGDDIFVSEINTVPGSLSQHLLSGNYKKFAKVLEEVISQAYADAAKEREKTVIHTGILNNVSLNACKLKN